MAGVEVVDVVDEGDRIAHVLARPLSESRVSGRVDWGHRFDHMQQHTGQHLLSAILADQFGQVTVGVHIGQEGSTIDLNTPSLTWDQAAKAEDRANEVVVQNRPVEVSYEEAGSAIGLRKPTQRTGVLRVVTIRNLDRSACGGTHVGATGEIGPIVIRKIERVRQGTRLEFLCGARALKRARADHLLLSQLAAGFSAAPDELPRLSEGLRTELKASEASRRELSAQLDLYRARELYTGALPDATGIRRVVVREETGSLERHRGVAQAFASLPKGILVTAVASPPAVLLAASPDAGVNAGGLLRDLLSTLGGRGGGSASLAQGTVPGREQLEMLVDAIMGGALRR